MSIPNHGINYTTHSRDTNKNNIAGSSSFNFANDNAGGNIFVMIHF